MSGICTETTIGPIRRVYESSILVILVFSR